MAMTMTSRRELYKLREIVHFVLAGAGGSKQENENPTGAYGAFVCFFCQKPMHDLNFITHGNSTGPKFDCAVSIHHIDGNHDNNEMLNKALCHSACHKSHHRREANLSRAAARKEKIS